MRLLHVYYSLVNILRGHVETHEQLSYVFRYFGSLDYNNVLLLVYNTFHLIDR